jgi:hypothetical protein
VPEKALKYEILLINHTFALRQRSTGFSAQLPISEFDLLVINDVHKLKVNRGEKEKL